MAKLPSEDPLGLFNNRVRYSPSSVVRDSKVVMTLDGVQQLPDVYAFNWEYETLSGDCVYSWIYRSTPGVHTYRVRYLDMLAKNFNAADHITALLVAMRLS